MTTTININSMLATIAALTGDDQKTSLAKIDKPSWLELKPNVDLVPSNGFTIAAGCVKTARLVLDALRIAKQQVEDKNEWVLRQMQRAEAGKVPGSDTTKGFNPDGTEYQEAIDEAMADIERLEAAIKNGEQMLQQIIEWVETYNDELHLTVVMGHTTEKDIIGNEFRRPKHVLLDRDVLPYAIANQKEFIATQRANS